MWIAIVINAVLAMVTAVEMAVVVKHGKPSILAVVCVLHHARHHATNTGFQVHTNNRVCSELHGRYTA